MQKQKRRWSVTTKFLFLSVGFFVGMMLLKLLLHEVLEWHGWLVVSVAYAVGMIAWERRKEKQT